MKKLELNVYTATLYSMIADVRKAIKYMEDIQRKQIVLPDVLAESVIAHALSFQAVIKTATLFDNGRGSISFIKLVTMYRKEL